MVKDAGSVHFEMLQNLQAQVCTKEPSSEEVIPQHIRRKRPKGKRAIDLSGIEVAVVNHYLLEDILNSEMPRRWYQMEDKIYTEQERISLSYKVVEHHVGICQQWKWQQNHEEVRF